MPFPYVIGILLLPVGLPSILVLTVAFFLGLGVDVESSTLGLHAAATTAMAFARPWVIDRLQTQQVRDKRLVPSLQRMGFSWTLRYTLLLVLLHHFVLHYLGGFPLESFLITTLKAIGNSLLTTAIVLVAELFLFPLPKVRNRSY